MNIGTAPVGPGASLSRDDRNALLLSVFMGLMIAGGYQVAAALGRPMLWALWAVQWRLVVQLAPGLPLRSLMKPIIPIFVWYVFYCAWGMVVSPVSAIGDAVRMVFYLTTVAFSMAILMGSANYFRNFANAAQFAALGNLLIMLALSVFPQFQDVFVNRNLVHADVQLYSQRFSGLWGNANAAGMMSLVIIALSVWASGSIAWVGRVSAAVIIYLTASRTASWILMLMVLMLVPRLSRRLAGKLMLAFVPLLMAVVLLTDQISLLSAISSDQNIARILDFDESRTVDEGKESRLDVLKNWLPVIEDHLWIGHGLNSMSGGGSQGVVFRSDVPYVGIHNIYLGIWVDVGILGFVSYLALMVQITIRGGMAKCDHAFHWGIQSILVTFWIFGLFNHNLLSDMIGLVVLTLLVLLPSSHVVLSRGFRLS